MQADQQLGILSTVKIKQGRADEYYRVLMRLAEEHTTREADCIDITVHRAADDPTRIMLYERWRITKDQFLAEQWTKPFLEAFTAQTRAMVEADEDVTYWAATHFVERGTATELAGKPS